MFSPKYDFQNIKNKYVSKLSKSRKCEFQKYYIVKQSMFERSRIINVGVCAGNCNFRPTRFWISFIGTFTNLKIGYILIANSPSFSHSRPKSHLRNPLFKTVKE